MYHMMARRYTAERAFEILQNLSSGESEQSETDNVSDLEIESGSSDASSDSENEIIVHPQTRESGRARGRGRGRATTSNTPSIDQNQGRDGTQWSTRTSDGRGRFQQKNIFTARPGPTSFSTRKVQDDAAASSFNVLFDERILRHILRCTIVEGKASLSYFSCVHRPMT